MVDLSDVPALTAQRFRTMSSMGEGGMPPVPTEGLPPGPTWPALAQTVALLRFRHWFHPYLLGKYGDVYTVRLVPRGRPLVMVTRPEHAKEVFAGDPEVFHAGKGNAILGPVMGRHSLLLQDSVEHKRARKLLMPAFNGQALKEYADLVSDLARAEVGTWGDGSSFRSLDRMNRLTLEVILRVVFGVTDEARLAALRPRVNATVEVSPAVLLGWTYPRLQKHGIWKRTVDNQHELDRLIFTEIRERRIAPDLHERSDVLSRLIVGTEEEGDPLSDVELRDQLVTLLLAGHETTATALAWAMYEVGPLGRPARAHPPRRRRGRRRLARGGAQGVDAAAPGDPDGGAHADEAGHDRGLGPAGRRHRRAVDHRQPRPFRQPSRPRGVPAGALPRAATRRPTPGSRSAAACAGASGPGSR